MLLISALSFFSCKKKGCTHPDAYNFDESAKKDDGSCQFPPSTEVTFQFLHFFDATPINASAFNALNYTNEFGNVISFTKLRYLISDFSFFKSNGDSVTLNNYHLIDLSDNGTLSYSVPTKIAQENYSAVAFNIGFNQSKNTSGTYADLNAANWGWPASIGGGYHSLQLEGNYITAALDTSGYIFHCGSTTAETSGSETIFHPNYIRIKLIFEEKHFGEAIKIELKMNLSEWFKNPNTWDLNVLNNGLMSNYDAQIKMRANGADVFSLGSITP